MTKRAEREQARAMRLAGRSYNEIAAALGVSKSSVSLWVRDLPRPGLSPAAEEARKAGPRAMWAQRRRETFVARQNDKLSWAQGLGPLGDRDLTIAAAVAYWAEGTKSKRYRPEERLTFVNSDQDLIRLWLCWLDSIGVGRDRCRFQLHIHESAGIDAALEFWSRVVQVPVGDFLPVVRKRHNSRTTRKNTGEAYVGCLSVRVLDSAALYRRVEGTWWAVASSARLRAQRPRIL
jgi:hypothetical protein